MEVCILEGKKKTNMQYKEILKSPLLHLPIKPVGSYKETISKVLNDFLEVVNNIENGNLNIQGLLINGAYVKSALNQFVRGLLDTVTTYLDGKPAKAYEKLERTLNSEVKNFGEILKYKTYEPNEVFFRLRITGDNFPLPATEMFHIPFQLRGRVATQRYSIPGFPCLYLARTIYGCWEEMNRPSISEFQAVKLTNTRPIKFLDLTRPQNTDQFTSRDVYHYFMTWPLIACCSVKVRDYSHTFKPEYIVPQLLLQWVREQEDIDGIKYNSTHIDFQTNGSIGDFSNIVLPVKENRDKGYCTRLINAFKMSESISLQLKETAIGGQIFLGANDYPVDNRIPKLEIIPGRIYPYSYSSIGMLENYLDSMELKSLDFLNDQ